MSSADRCVTLKSGLETIRPGRTLFCRKLRLGDSATKPTLNLLFVHGSCASSAQYDALVEVIAATEPKSFSMDCIMYDAFGCGESPLDPNANFSDYSTEEAVRDLNAVYQTLNHYVPTVLIGHSYAPSAITRFLLEYPCENVVGLIYISSALKDGPAPIPDGGHPIFMLPVFILKCLQNKLSQTFCDSAFHPKSDPLLREASLVASNKNDMGMCKAYARQMKFATTEEAKEAQGQRSALVIHGQDDRIMPLVGGEHLSDVMNAKLVVIPETSHQVMQEKPQEVGQAVSSFLLYLLMR